MTVSAGEARHFVQRSGSDAPQCLPADTHEDESISAVPRSFSHTLLQCYGPGRRGSARSRFSSRSDDHTPAAEAVDPGWKWPILAGNPREGTNP